MLKQHQIIECLNEISELTKYTVPLNIIETGTIRNLSSEYRIKDGHSTSCIASWIKNTRINHSFTSVDLDIAVASKHLKDMGLSQYVNLVQSDSVEYIKKLSSDEKFNFVYLDSDNDADLIFDEFIGIITKVSDKCIILVDDVNPGCDLRRKGNKLVPWLEANNWNFKLNRNYQCVIRLYV